jgi:mRNA-degrading endonuclease toxin of MazEF toxin-antitoxin module
MPARGDSFQSANYVPRKGDVVHLNWSPAVGNEMLGPHYGLVLSEDLFNISAGVAYLVPITSKVNKLSGFHLPLQAGRVQGVALLTGLRALDYQTRDIQYEATANPTLVSEANRRLWMILPQ